MYKYNLCSNLLEGFQNGCWEYVELFVSQSFNDNCNDTSIQRWIIYLLFLPNNWLFWWMVIIWNVHFVAYE